MLCIHFWFLNLNAAVSFEPKGSVKSATLVGDRGKSLQDAGVILFLIVKGFQPQAL